MAALNGRGFFAIALVVAVAAISLFSMPRLEGDAPLLTGPEAVALGQAGREIEIEALDAGTGLQSLQVRIVSAGGGKTIYEQTYVGKAS